MYEKDQITRFKIAQISKWIINLETIGGKPDTILSVSLFDTTGRIIEERSNYSNSNSLYTSIKYVYNSNGYLIDKVYDNPYSFHWSPWERSAPDSLEIIRYEFQRVKSKTKIWLNGLTKVYEYSYVTYLQDGMKEYYYIRNRLTLYTDYERTFDPECRYSFSVKDKNGIAYCVVDTDLLDYILITTNNVLTSVEKYEYVLRK